MFYATHHSDGGRIQPNADIIPFDTREEAEAWLRSAYGSEWDQATIKIEPGHWGDCWIKTIADPMETWLDVLPFTLDDVNIHRPGSHPGGPFYWLTPWADVLVVTEAVEICA